MHFSKSLQGSRSAITMRPISIESTFLLFLFIIFANYHYFRNISYSLSPLFQVNIINFLNTGLIFTTEYLFYVKSYGRQGDWRPRPEGVNFDTPLSINLL